MPLSELSRRSASTDVRGRLMGDRDSTVQEINTLLSSASELLIGTSSFLRLLQTKAEEDRVTPEELSAAASLVDTSNEQVSKAWDATDDLKL